MRCKRCGLPKIAHSRADGAAPSNGCPAFVEKWPEEPKADKPAPVRPSKAAAPSSEK